MDEFGLIERYFSRHRAGGDVRVSVGDDAAILDVAPDRQLVMALDTLVEGVHYPQAFDPADIGYRAVTVNLSDLAAMAATPAWMLLGLTLPAADERWLHRFADGLYAAADGCGLRLVGGDTTRGAQIVVTVQISGTVARDRYLSRSGARQGDAIYVSGMPGEAAAGLAALKNGTGAAHPDLLRRFRRPEPRLQLGAALAGVATAAIDVSDGLHDDLERLLRAAGCGGELDCRCLPLSPALLAAGSRDQALEYALSGGDDYELCFTVAENRESALPAIAAETGVTLTRIGSVTGSGRLAVVDGNSERPMHSGGYRHF